jgi:predicted GNAT family N-acyltransferase
MDDYEVRRIPGDGDRDDAFEIRRRVFIDEQGVTESQEFDGLDDEAIHVVAYSDDQAVGTARLRFPDDGVAKIERVAVRKHARGEGIGRTLVRTLEAEAQYQVCSELVLHAQTTVEGFYQSLGYETVSDVFVEDGIEHVKMTQSLR